MSSVIVHIEDGEPNFDADITVVVARCGATAIIGPDGWPVPRGFDFVMAKDADLADCPGCVASDSLSSVDEAKRLVRA